MPELPEVQNVCLGLADTVVGQTIARVSVRRRDIVHGPSKPTHLLRGQTVTRIDRLGKQIALIGQPLGRETSPNNPPCICIHLGMTGSLRYYPKSTPHKPDNHTHIIWHLTDGGRLVFRDPRRFGGLWTFDSVTSLNQTRWSKLGNDALKITPASLHAKLLRTRRPIKAALLDQAVLAGLGNIYVDELLYRCEMLPMRLGCDVTRRESQRLVRQMRSLLGKAIRLGGSTLRDYVDASGQSGGFQHLHQVYGRSGQPCPSCAQSLACITVSGRTTVYCENCQS
ncbi:MAG: bifunctional DNA-formamidopyrimidine glycosylase/DNA-(apurinic or apyrimidinic site) lyase [Opitutaceae bacterium]|nr:bifunctional DNA-formamidopyrimidine glycosylase/DNA-(apurinic or apyrimidinic site) lyase [Opitutaceae bacterium]